MKERRKRLQGENKLQELRRAVDADELHRRLSIYAQAR